MFILKLDMTLETLVLRTRGVSKGWFGFANDLSVDVAT